MKKFMLTLLMASAFLAAAVAPASANDSSAAIGLGGLELTRNDAISMDSEELYLSREKVVVKYRFTNTSTKNVETLVSFPLPIIPGGIEGYLGDMSYPTWKTDLNFKTLVDGEPVQLEMREVVSLIGDPKSSDIGAELQKLGWPIRWWENAGILEKLQALSPAEKASAVAKGYLIKEKETDFYNPNWQIQTHVTRKQIFPAGKTITVEHSYKPVMGGSVGGMLMKQYRTRKDSGFAEYAKAYCMDKAFLKGFDGKMDAQKKSAKARGDDGNYGMFIEHWLDYVLKSGANWKGPIKDFRLVVDKGKADNLVSFCMEGVKKIGPTQFEVRKSNFEPAKDLNVLIVEIHDPNTM
jgi:hypothetical protein